MFWFEIKIGNLYHVTWAETNLCHPCEEIIQIVRGDEHEKGYKVVASAVKYNDMWQKLIIEKWDKTVGGYKEVPVTDLPLYLYLPYKSPLFMELLDGMMV